MVARIWEQGLKSPIELRTMWRMWRPFGIQLAGRQWLRQMNHHLQRDWDC